MHIVDAHPHIYSNNRNKYPTISDPWNPGEPATAEDLKSKMDSACEALVPIGIFIASHANTFLLKEINAINTTLI